MLGMRTGVVNKLKMIRDLHSLPILWKAPSAESRTATEMLMLMVVTTI